MYHSQTIVFFAPLACFAVQYQAYISTATASIFIYSGAAVQFKWKQDYSGGMEDYILT